MIIQKIHLIVATCAERKIHKKTYSVQTNATCPSSLSKKKITILAFNFLLFVFNNADKKINSVALVPGY